MTEPAENKTPKKLSLHKQTLEMFAAETTVAVMEMKERLHQKKEKVLEAVPFLKKTDDRLKRFDAKMEKKYGQVYTKLRDSAKNIARTVLAAKFFGLPGIVGMCAYKTCEKAMSLLEPAEKAAERGEVKGILDYFSKNKDEAGFTMTSGALSIASAACDVAGAPVVKGAVRVGKASLLITPEVKALLKATKKWLCGKESFKEVRRNAAVVGITFGTYFVADVPMTRGAGKPKVQDKGGKKDETQRKGGDYAQQVAKLFADGYGNPGGIVTVPETPKAPAAAGQVKAQAAPSVEEAGNVPAKKEEYKYDVARMMASGAGNPGGMITVFDIKKQKSGR